MEASIIVIGLLAVLIAVFLAQGLRIVQQSECMVIERLGSFHRVLNPGINLIIPFVDQPRQVTVQGYTRTAQRIMTNTNRIDQRETVLDFPSQPMITRDNVAVRVNGAIYYQVVDPKSVVYTVENFVLAVETLTRTTLRSVVGNRELDDLLENRDEVNQRLLQILDEAGEKWGVKVTRVEIQDIDLPEEIEEAMRAQMTAERKRRATVTEANGHREAEIKQAEGDKEAAVLRADGDREAAIRRAEGERKAIETILSAGGDKGLNAERVTGYLLGLEYLRTLPNIAKEGDRVFLPAEFSQLGSTIGAFSDLAGKLKQ
ncbi:regulator of protease activity HflC (stomatin/prohibitin superfamily) [Natronospira proteinivora]|uniref:Regulator of protease activity HflC (Stomatin/prohibitin superfamily) n=1 Tax=Natronospira proteinivora TaxID=1807133 RepID=A0ABT1G4R8_9GAMM|nr:SPFH domain-containing protein [Natronospira proteinivora]MCP1726291.1 regulator of protease activity HflC (stomatin/prohibitin superfamily) [Natronospira proteinivora]